jgi:hypothetical protein
MADAMIKADVTQTSVEESSDDCKLKNLYQ